ncbi:hypothetical protein ACE6H2_019768 [Prunus campanulata]
MPTVKHGFLSSLFILFSHYLSVYICVLIVIIHRKAYASWSQNLRLAFGDMNYYQCFIRQSRS